MKAVVLGINPQAKLIDLTHEIPAGDIRAGAFALMAGFRFFPKGTVHVAIVDPGVGSPRRALAVQTQDYLFVGPDNGVLSWALAREPIKAVHQLENKMYFLEPVSRTFHGRDIFAPVAAHLSRGVQVDRFGRELADWVRLPWPAPTQCRGALRGEVVYVDRFGNAVTNLNAELLLKEGVSTCEVRGRRKVRCGVGAFYGAVPAHQPIAVIGSSGFLEIAVNGDSAARQLGLRIGNEVIIQPNSEIRP